MRAAAVTTQPRLCTTADYAAAGKKETSNVDEGAMDDVESSGWTKRVREQTCLTAVRHRTMT